ncbi:MAG TPA: aminoglycoside phosphotransferase family protein [Ilumatobacteraceae bacterium]|nr:aminoglycoside phosphotransferase family protein [Ilumatobacteraceae bacterium]
MEKRDITPAVAAGLVAAQFPQWADLPVVPVAIDGWDNTTFRLGDELSIRLPSGDGYVAQVEKEHRWLPILAAHLPVQIPEPVAVGRPDGRFPRPWSIYRWIDGETATVDRIGDLTDLATDLAGFLTALEAIDASDGPPAGAHNFFRGGPLTVYDAETRATIERAPDEIDLAAAGDAWEAALASTWERPPVWVHGDVAPSNLLVGGGVLRAVIDFGCSGVGDPACDLVMAWTFFDDESRVVFRDTLALDEATWSRARGWALWKAVVTVVHASATGYEHGAAARRWGWRFDPLDVVQSVLADHA